MAADGTEQPGLTNGAVETGAPDRVARERRVRWPGGRGRPAPAEPGSVTVTPRTDSMLEVRDLRVHFPTDDGLVKAVDGISFSLDRGRTLGIVGESGSGKSVTSLAIMGMHHGTNARLGGQIFLDGEELVS